MSDELDAGTELAVGESLVTEETEDLVIETIRTEETLFVTTYTDAETGELRLALRIDVATGKTALDPRHVDASFWTLVAGDRERPMEELRAALGEFRDPSIEVEAANREIRVYSGTRSDR